MLPDVDAVLCHAVRNGLAVSGRTDVRVINEDDASLNAFDGPIVHVRTLAGVGVGNGPADAGSEWQLPVTVIASGRDESRALAMLVRSVLLEGCTGSLMPGDHVLPGFGGASVDDDQLPSRTAGPVGAAGNLYQWDAVYIVRASM